MKQHSFKACIAISILCAGISITACKSKDTNTNGEKNDTSSTYMEPKQDNTVVKPDTTQAPQISTDDSLTTMSKDAVKDFPGVTATISNGEVTLTGSISRDKLPKLLQAIHAAHPKKVNNNLTIK